MTTRTRGTREVDKNQNQYVDTNSNNLNIQNNTSVADKNGLQIAKCQFFSKMRF